MRKTRIHGTGSNIFTGLCFLGCDAYGKWRLIYMDPMGYITGNCEMMQAFTIGVIFSSYNHNLAWEWRCPLWSVFLYLSSTLGKFYRIQYPLVNHRISHQTGSSEHHHRLKRAFKGKWISDPFRGGCVTTI